MGRPRRLTSSSGAIGLDRGAIGLDRGAIGLDRGVLGFALGAVTPAVLVPSNTPFEYAPEEEEEEEEGRGAPDDWAEYTPEEEEEEGRCAPDDWAEYAPEEEEEEGRGAPDDVADSGASGGSSVIRAGLRLRRCRLRGRGSPPLLLQGRLQGGRGTSEGDGQRANRFVFSLMENEINITDKLIFRSNLITK